MGTSPWPCPSTPGGRPAGTPGRTAWAVSQSVTGSKLSLAVPATGTLVVTKLCLSRQIFVTTHMSLSRQRFCLDKHTFLSRQKKCFVCDKSMPVTTKLLLPQNSVCHDKSFVVTKVWALQKYSVVTNSFFFWQQIFCYDKHAFVMTKDIFCHDQHVFVMTNMCLL